MTDFYSLFLFAGMVSLEYLYLKVNGATLLPLRIIMVYQDLGYFRIIFKVGHSPSKKNYFISFSGSSLIMMKTSFISCLKLFLLSIYIKFCLDFLVIQKKQLDQKDKVNSKVYNITTWFTNNYNTLLSNISQSKGSQPMKFGQLIEYKKKNIFFKNYAENEGKKTNYRPLFFTKKKKKALHSVKASCLQLSFNIFWEPWTLHKIKTKCIILQTTEPEICSILIFQKRICEQFLRHILFMTF